MFIILVSACLLVNLPAMKLTAWDNWAVSSHELTHFITHIVRYFHRIFPRSHSIYSIKLAWKNQYASLNYFIRYKMHLESILVTNNQGFAYAIKELDKVYSYKYKKNWSSSAERKNAIELWGCIQYMHPTGLN